MYLLFYREGHLTSMEGWPQRTRGSRRSRSARAQGRYANPRGYAPLESTAMVAYGNQCAPFSIVTPTRANSEGQILAKIFQRPFSINFLAISGIF